MIEDEKIETADMNDAADLREETAETSPERAEHDRIGALEAELAEAKSSLHLLEIGRAHV